MLWWQWQWEKKSKGLNRQNNNSAWASRFFWYISLPPLHDFFKVMPYFLVHGGHKQATRTFFSELGYGFPIKWCLRNECGNLLLTTHHYTLGQNFWLVEYLLHPIKSSTQILVVKCHQWGIYALVPQKSFCRKLVDVVQNVDCFLSLFWMLYLTSLLNQSLCLAKNVFYNNRIQIQIAVANMLFILPTCWPKGKLGSVAEGSAVLIWGPAGRGPMSPIWILKHLVSVFINACCLLSALPSLSQLGQGRLSLVAISFYALLLLFGPCHLSEFTLAGPLIYFCVARWV